MRAFIRVALLTALVARSCLSCDFEKAKKLGAQLQSAVAKQDASSVHAISKRLLESCPGDSRTYYAGLTTGSETRLEMGIAADIVGTSASLRLNQYTKAVGETLTIDKFIPGLTILHTGVDVLENLLEFGYQYRYEPSSGYPIYHHDTLCRGSVQGSKTGKSYGRYARDYSQIAEKNMVLIDPTSADVEALSRFQVVNIVFADLTEKNSAGKFHDHLVVRAHYTLRNGEWIKQSGSIEKCDVCKVNIADFKRQSVFH